MVIDIKMCRFDNVPWGFRLVGGADYDYPLTVVKVTEGSIAEEAGLCVEDVIVRINDTAATPLTHDEAHRLIMNSGSVFYFGVYREREPEELEQFAGPRRFPVSASSLTMSPPPGAGAGAGQSPTAFAPSPVPVPVPVHGSVADPIPELIPVPMPEPVRASVSPQRTEAAKAPGPEQEEEQVEVAQLEANVAELECGSAMTEMHSHANDSQGGGDSGDCRLYLPDLPDRPCSAMSERAEIKLVEEEIAAVLSGESEVLKEHNVLGIFPKPGVCMTSDVLRSLNEEVTKTKLEKEQENRKWSTFLQRPDRPVPKSKQQLEAERRAANAYKVKIVKSAPRDKSPMPEAKPKEDTPPEPVAEQEKPEEQKEQQEPGPQPEPEPEVEVEEPLPTDSEVPNLEQLPDNGNVDGEGEQLEKADASKEQAEQQTEAAEADEQQTVVTPAQAETEKETESEGLADGGPKTPPKTEEELALEQQLADVQKQLAALSSLPSTIQTTLDAVTKQLAELLPTFKLHQQQKDQIEGEGNGEQQQQQQEGSCEREREREQEQVRPEETAPENNEDKCDANDREVAEISLSNGDNRQLEQERELELEQQEQHQLSEDLSFKKQKIAFWNRLFNGEHITRQRFRVNFMKYQKPERKIDLNRSEVYKVIHHLDRAPVRGIEVRAPLVAAESDIRQALQS